MNYPEPPTIFFNEEYINKLINEEKNMVINELKSFYKKPFYLGRKEKHKKTFCRSLSMWERTEDEKDEIFKFINQKENLTYEKLNTFFLKYSECYREYDNGYLLKMKNNLKSNQIYNVRIEKETFHLGLKRLQFVFEEYNVYYKGDDLETDYVDFEYQKFYSNPECFNIIRKEFKLMQESRRDFYTKYFTEKPFTQFEECGIEVLYARKGYAIDGKRLPSFNRGSVYGLKQSLKQNKIKQKGLTKKDDIIKVLLKI